MIPFVKRFVAGNTAEEAMAAVRRLNSEGLKATLDYLGEECKSPEQAAASEREIVRLFDLIAREKVDSNVSVKLTQIGLNLDPALAKDHLIRILDAAARRGNFVRLDMEGSAYTQRTLDLFYDVFRTHRNAGVVIQAYLRRSDSDIEGLIQAGVRVRLCKGAYKEPAAIAFQSREEVDRNYDLLARKLIERGDYPGIATHDDGRIQNAADTAQAKDIGKDRFEFQMLYGVRRPRWKELVGMGFNLRIYTPYGTRWLPYYYRRIRERKENLIFALRSLIHS